MQNTRRVTIRGAALTADEEPSDSGKTMRKKIIKCWYKN